MTTIRSLHVRGYRSLRDVRVELGRVTVVVGANGSGKSNLYSALRLAQHAAHGTLGRTIADEGGMPSVLWAGPLRGDERRRVDLALAFDDVVYELSIGLVAPPPRSEFLVDPEVKEESISVLLDAPRGRARKTVTMLERAQKGAFGRDRDGNRVTWPVQLWEGESVLSQLRDPGRFPVPAELAARLSAMRFYHQLSVEPGSPVRAPQHGVRTGRLASDGRDLAAAWRTIQEIGDDAALASAVAGAFPGSSIEIEVHEGTFALQMRMPGLLRPLHARELSDGTLRFLCLVAALEAPRPAPFLALNEPESSLHPDVLPALAERIAASASRSQILVTTHSRPLADAIAARTETTTITLDRSAGATTVRRRSED